MREHFPKLFPGLVFSALERRADAAVVVKTPHTRQYFRLGALEYEIACQLDGRTSPAEIRARIKKQHGVELDQETLDEFLRRLGQAGLLEAREPRHEALPGGLPSQVNRLLFQVRHSPLFIRLKAFDPDAILNYLLPRTQFFFTRQFVGLSGLVILLGMGIFFSHTAEVMLEARALFTLSSLLLLWPALFLIISLHEFAHGLTCKHFGGEVREMGFLLLFFQPCFYCNVSDAWLFPQKSRRLWVTFAGAYFELFCWALAVLCWRITEPATLIHQFSLVVVLSSGIKALFNLNPLIKLDGYYLLSDLLDIPNLRPRAFAFLTGGRAVREATPPRRRRIYLLYGLLAGTYSFILLGYIALSVTSFLTARYQAWGAVLASGLIFGLGGTALIRLGGHMKHFILRTWESLKASGQRRRRMILGGIAFLLFLFVPWPLKISTEFQVAPMSNADVRAEVSGFIEAVYVREGQRVQQGQLLARIRETDLRAETDKLEKGLAEKDARLRLLRAGASPEEIDLLRKEVETARTRHDHSQRQLEEATRRREQQLRKAGSSLEKAVDRLKFANQELSRAESLYTQGMISQKKHEETLEQRDVREKELEEAQADLALLEAGILAEHRQKLAVASREYEEAQSRLAELLGGARPQEIEAAEAELAKLQVGLQYQKEQLSRTRIVSPEDGVVVTPKVEEKVGEFVERGDLICEVFDYGRVRAEMAVPEKELADVAVGQKVILKARAFPAETFRGYVTAISPRVIEKDIENVAVAYTEVENSDLKLRPGMTGYGKIYAGRRPLAAVMVRRLVRTVRVEFWSWF